jgi:hypothetical protein
LDILQSEFRTEGQKPLVIGGDYRSTEPVGIAGQSIGQINGLLRLNFLTDPAD